MSGRGRLISLEGIEGVGKSTHLPALADLLRGRGAECVATREPGGTPFGGRVRELLLSGEAAPASAEAELLLLFAARAEHLQAVIRPALARGAWVLTDRFLDASFVYQGLGRELGAERVQALVDWLMPGLRPDLVLVLDADVDEALARVRRRGRPDRFERQAPATFARLRQCYLERAAADPGRYQVVDTQRPIAEVRADLERRVERLLP